MEGRQLWWLISDVFGLAVCIVAAIAMVIYAIEKVGRRFYGAGP